MTGPEHYREAERLLAPVSPPGMTPNRRPDDWQVAAAQAHATLALVAVTYQAAPGDYVREWSEVID